MENTMLATEQSIRRSTFSPWLWSALACVLLVGLSILLLDRPIASFSHEHFHGISVFVRFTQIPETFFPIAALVFAGVALTVARGRQVGPIGDTLLRCSLSLVAAATVKDQLKYVFGRTWPETWINNNPSFIGNGTFEFAPFHGAIAYASFPSGHITAMCAVMAVLWLRWPRFRWLYGFLVALVVVGFLGADYHWLSDIIAGGFLGTAAGVTAARIGRRDA